MFASLIPVKHPRINFAVIYTDPVRKEKSGRKKRIVKHFVHRSDAEAYQKEINKNMPVAGVAGLALDAPARADFFAARQILDAAGFSQSLVDVARDFVARHPSRKDASLALDEALLEEFLAHKRDVEKAKERTVGNLKTRVNAWIKFAGLSTISDITHEACLALRVRKGLCPDKPVSATTRKNDMNAVSSFLTWLVDEKKVMKEHPMRGTKRPRADDAKRVVWTAAQARAWMDAAAVYREGRFVPALVSLLMGGLRPSEQTESRFVLTGKPALRAEGGKLRGRANRTVPLGKAAVAWLKACPPREDGTFPELSVKGRAALERLSGLTWVPDAPRHTFISARMAIVQHEGQVAREAGTSVEIVFKHYHRVLTRAQAVAVLGILPEAAKKMRDAKALAA
ncbi:site-specific recombinase XerD [Opitutaceae bacterium TAV1]|nr:site-specific recombinase XerD [Opitutaceae bacterium TAV1]